MAGLVGTRVLSPMTMDPRLRLGAFGAAGAILAVFVGAQLAAGQHLLALAVLLPPAVIVIERWIPSGAIGLMLGALLMGNVIGNRGFAQLTPTPSLPLYPAEIGLALGAVWLLVQGARGRRLPLRFDTLGIAVAAWMVLSSLRLPFDVRLHGIDAARDYALVYYAGFFFLARHAAEHPPVRRALHRAWVLTLLGLFVMYPFYIYNEVFFLTGLTVHGLPVIAIKSDLAGTFAAAGALYATVRWRAAREWRWSLLLCACLGLALFIVSRAAFVGMLVTVLVFMPHVRGKFALTLVLLVGLGLLASASQVAFGERTWRETRLYDVYEHAVSLFDVSGSGTYQGEASQDTGDNTRFRIVWWRVLIDRGIREHPLTGAGYGADISSEFARDYLGPGAGDFTARSPHNVILTVFARTGLAGLLPFLVLLGVIALSLWRARRVLIDARRSASGDGALADTAMGCAALVILVSACFGVVLEGPMGAVVFWTLLGVAFSRPANADSGPATAETHETHVQPWHAPAERPNRTPAPGSC